MALDPEFTNGRPVRLRPLHVQQGPVASARPALGRRLPDPAGARPTAASCPGGSRGSGRAASRPLITDWCQQFPSHSIGDLVFGPDGALYVSAGDGASFNFADYGQDGSPINPCGDPRGGSSPTPPTAEGGALRCQDVRSAGDPTGVDGDDPARRPGHGRRAARTTRTPASADPMTRRIVAYGFRNPFRFTLRPGTDEIWAGDVGWNNWEEINRIAAPTAARDATSAGRATRARPRERLRQRQLNALRDAVRAGRRRARRAALHLRPRRRWCRRGLPVGRSSVSGLAFYTGGTSRPATATALFFADYSRSCIWFMPAGVNGLPDPSQRDIFGSGTSDPVNLAIGPDGDALLPRHQRRRGPARSATARRTTAPTARATATPTSGAAPLPSQFDGTQLERSRTATRSPTRGTSTATARSTTRPPRSRRCTYTGAGRRHRRLRVTDRAGCRRRDDGDITAGAPPVARIDTPAAPRPGRSATRSRSRAAATTAAASRCRRRALTWKLVLQHCPGRRRLPHAPPADFAGVARARSPRPTTSTRPTWSCSSPPPTRPVCRDTRHAPAGPARRST